MVKQSRSSIKSNKGASLIEYALLVAMIALVAYAALTYFFNRATNSLQRTATAVATGQPGGGSGGPGGGAGGP
jgi:Flp pilus assembly pilin Flp